MTTFWLVIVTLVLLLGFFAIGTPIAVSMGLLGFLGIVIFAGFDIALQFCGQVPYSTLTNFLLVAIPLFILMGSWASTSGMVTDFFNTVRNWIGRLPGGVGMAAIFGAAGFSAVSGSSIATAAAIGMISLPEMRRIGYSAEFSAGCVAAGGTLGIMIPPSGIFIIYGWLTEVSVGKMFIAGIFPGLLSVLLWIAMITLLPKFMPEVYGTLKLPSVAWPIKIKSLTGAFPVIVLAVAVLGGIYAGFFTPTEAAAVGAILALLYAVARGKLKFKDFNRSILDAGEITAMVGFIIVGAMMFSYYLALTGFPTMLSDFLANLGVSKWLVLVGILCIYLALGMFMDTFAMVLITIPIFFPVAMSLGFNPIWFGIIVCKMCEIALITPPVGMNVYVISGLLKDVSLQRIFKGVIPFLLAELVTLTILVIFPQISTFLPGLMD